MASAQDCLGLHFPPNHLMCAVAHRRGRRTRVSSLNRFDFHLALDEGGSVTQPEQQGVQLRQVLQAARFHFPRNVALSLPEEHCFQLTIGIQQPDAATSLTEAVRWEAAQHLPYEMNELIMDWTTVGAEKNTVLIQVCAAPKTLVESYCALFDAAGYTAIAIEPASRAAARTLALPEPDPLVCIVLGESSTTLAVIMGASVPLTINSEHCTDASITDLFQKKLHLSAHDADKAKMVCGFDPSVNRGEVRTALMDALRGLLADITATQNFLTDHDAAMALRGIVLTGPGALVKYIDRELAQQTHLPVFLHPPRKDVLIAHVPPREMPTQMAEYAFPIGAALHR